MASRQAKNYLAVFIVWVVIVLLLAVAYRTVVAPHFAKNSARERAMERYEEVAARATERGLSLQPLPDDADGEAILQQAAELEERLTGSHVDGIAIEHRTQTEP